MIVEHGDGFDYEQWLDSVKDKQLQLTSPREAGIGANRNALCTSMTARKESETYCSSCDEMRLLVCSDSTDQDGVCPVCGLTPSSEIALGVRTADDWDELSKEEKQVSMMED